MDLSLFPIPLIFSRSRIAGNTALEIWGKTKPLREAGVLHVEPWNEAGVRKGKKILCHKCDEDVGNMDSILLSSLRTIRNANIDIPHHMDKSLDGISSPLLFLQDKDPRRSRKKGTSSRARASAHIGRNFNRDHSCAVLLASNTPAAREYVEGRFRGDMDCQLHCLCEMDEDDVWMIP